MRSREPRVLAVAKQPIPVSLAHFAAIGGYTEQEYIEKVIIRLESGDLISMLRNEAQVDFLNWLPEEGSRFVVRFTLSLNRVTDVALYCVCHREKPKADGLPAWTISHTIPGICHPVPREAIGLPIFEVYFCDMKFDLE